MYANGGRTVSMYADVGRNRKSSVFQGLFTGDYQQCLARGPTFHLPPVMSVIASTGNITLAPAGARIKCGGKGLDSVGQLSVVSPTDVVVYVSSAGNDVNGTGAIGAPYLTLPRAFQSIASTGWDRSATVVIASTAFSIPAGILRLVPGPLGRQQYPVHIVGGGNGTGRTLVGTNTISSLNTLPTNSQMPVSFNASGSYNSVPFAGTLSTGYIVRFITGPLSAYTPTAILGGSTPTLGVQQVEAYITSTANTYSYYAPDAAGVNTYPAAGNAFEVYQTATTVTVPTDAVVVQSTASKIVWRNLNFQFAGAVGTDRGAVVFDGVDTELYGVSVLPCAGLFAFKAANATCDAGGYTTNSGCPQSPWQVPTMLGTCINTTAPGGYLYEENTLARFQFKSSVFLGQGSMRGNVDLFGCYLAGAWQLTAADSYLTLKNCALQGSTVRALAGGAVDLANVDVTDLSTFTNPAVGALGGTVNILPGTTGGGLGLRILQCVRSLEAIAGTLLVSSPVEIDARAGASSALVVRNGSASVAAAAAFTFKGAYDTGVIVFDTARVVWDSALSLTAAVTSCKGGLSMVRASATFAQGASLTRVAQFAIAVDSPFVAAEQGSELRFLGAVAITDSYAGSFSCNNLVYVSDSTVEMLSSFTLAAGSRAATGLGMYSGASLAVVGAVNITQPASAFSGRPLVLVTRSRLAVSDPSLVTTPNLSLTGGGSTLQCTQGEVFVQGDITCSSSGTSGSTTGKVVLESYSSLQCKGSMTVTCGSAFAVTALAASRSKVYVRSTLAVTSGGGAALDCLGSQLLFGVLNCTGLTSAIYAYDQSTLTANTEAVGAVTYSLIAAVTGVSSTGAALRLARSTAQVAGAQVTGSENYGLYLERGAKMNCNGALACSTAGGFGFYKAIYLTASRLTVKGAIAVSGANGLKAVQSAITADSMTASGTDADGIFVDRSDISVTAITANTNNGYGLYVVAGSNIISEAVTLTGNLNNNLLLSGASTMRVYGASEGTATMNVSNVPANAGNSSNCVVQNSSQLYVDGAVTAAGATSFLGKTDPATYTSGVSVTNGSSFTTNTFSYIDPVADTNAEYGLSALGGSHVSIRGSGSGAATSAASPVRGTTVAGLYIEASTFDVVRPSLGFNTAGPVFIGRIAAGPNVAGGGVYVTRGSYGRLDSPEFNGCTPCGLGVADGSQVVLASNNNNIPPTYTHGSGFLVKNGSSITYSKSTFDCNVSVVPSLDATAAGRGHGIYVTRNSSFTVAPTQKLQIANCSGSGVFVEHGSRLAVQGDYTSNGNTLTGVTVENGSNADIRGSATSSITGAGGGGIVVNRGSIATVGQLAVSTNQGFGMRVSNHSRAVVAANTLVGGTTAQVSLGSKGATTWAVVSSATAPPTAMTDYSNASTQLCVVSAK
jgi:hypothetical protein